MSGIGNDIADGEEQPQTESAVQSGLPATATAKRGVVEQLNDDEFNAWKAVGGVRGALESVLPALIFVVFYVATMELKWPIIASVGVSLILILARAIARQPMTYSISGLVGVGVGTVWALATGRGENFFAFGIIVAAIYGIVIAFLSLFRFPVVSMTLTPVWQLPWRWWRSEDSIAEDDALGSISEHDRVGLTRLARVAGWLSWLWFGLFAIRVAVQVPMWVMGQVAALGTMKIVLGLPLFLLVAWLTWVKLRPFKPLADAVVAQLPKESEEEPGATSASD